MKHIKSALRRVLDFAGNHPGTASAITAVALTLTVATVVGLDTSRNAIPEARERYERVTAARIVGEPTYDKEDDSSLTQARVEITDGPHKGATATLAVDEQAAQGDPWTVYWDTESQRIWRTDSAGNTPYPAVAEDAALGALAGFFASLVTILAVFVTALALEYLCDSMWFRQLRHRLERHKVRKGSTVA